MSLTIGSITLEFYWGQDAYFSGIGHEVLIKFSSGLPFWFFSKFRHENTLELWGFGMNWLSNPVERVEREMS